MSLSSKILAVLFVLALPVRAAEVKLVFWHSMTGDKGKLVDQLVEGFNRTQAGKYRVQAQFVGTYIEGLHKIRTALLAKRAPDIVQIFEIGTQVMIDTGAVRPLGDLIASDPGFPSSLILPEIRRYYEIRGKLYSLPFATSNPILYYNRRRFEEAGLKPPATFTELRTVARKLSSGDGRRTGITWPLHGWIFEQFVALQGRDLVNNDNGRADAATETRFTDPAAVTFIRLWADMVGEKSFANVGRGWEPAEQNFLSGRSAMLVTSSSDVFEIPAKAPFPVATAPLPRPDAPAQGGTVVGGNSLWILKGKPEKEKGSYEFIKYMASAEVQKFWHTHTGYFPIRKDVFSDLVREGFYRKHPNARTGIDQLLRAAPVTASQGALVGVFQEMREIVESAIEQVLSGKAPPEAALGRAKAKADEALQRYDRMRRS